MTDKERAVLEAAKWWDDANGGDPMLGTASMKLRAAVRDWLRPSGCWRVLCVCDNRLVAERLVGLLLKEQP